MLNNIKLAVAGISQATLADAFYQWIVLLPKSANPDHMRANADLDFTISEADMATLKGVGIDYGEARAFPVFGKKRRADNAALRG